MDDRALDKDDWPPEVLYMQWEGDTMSGGVRQVYCHHDVFFLRQTCFPLHRWRVSQVGWFCLVLIEP